MLLPGPGDVFQGRYRIERHLGRGAHGLVCLAQDRELERRVAIKLFAPDGPDDSYRADTQMRFHREARAIATLRSPNTVHVFDSGTSDSGLLFLVFEYIDGSELAQLLEDGEGLPAADVVHITRQMLTSLREAHAAGIIHRDIKPENIVISTRGRDQLHATLLDFSIAYATADGRITRTGELLGTPRYMSPEALTEAEITPRSDLYSLGIVVLEMLAGRPALHGNAWIEQLDRLQTGYVFSAPVMQRIPADFQKFIARMTARAPADRFADAAAALAALDALDFSEDATTVPRARRRTRAPRRAGRTRTQRRGQGQLIMWGIVGALLGAAALAAVVRFRENRRTTRAPEQIPLTQPAQLVVSPLPDAHTPTDTATTDTTHDVAVSDPGSALDIVEDTGCGKEPPGFNLLGDTPGSIGTQSWEMAIPGRYSADQKHPLLILFHTDMSTPREFIASSRFTGLDTPQPPIVVAPLGRNPAAWRNITTASQAQELVGAVSKVVCVDPERVFVVGHGTGGRAALNLSCTPWITAIAVLQYLPRPREVFCAPASSKPVILINPTNSKHIRLEGGEGCGILPKSMISLGDWERHWRDRNGCAGSAREETQHRDGVCRRYACDAPLASCEDVGGFGWPGSAPRDAGRDPWKCDGTPAQFPAEQVIWEFFDSIDRN